MSKIKAKVTYILMAINVVVFELVFSMPEGMMKHAFALLSLSSENFIQLWRIFTSMFLHASATHLFFNMLALYFFGRVVEEEKGGAFLLKVYFLAGISGGVLHSLLVTNPAVGASAAIFGVMAAAMFIRPTEIISIYIFPLPLGIVALMYVMLSAIAILYAPLLHGVSHVAHVGGMLAGTAYTLLTNPWKSIKSLAILIFLFIFTILFFPVIALFIGSGSILLSIVDYIIGSFLYGFAKLISFIW
ncbi:MAG TPA: rhomboid family intramembrane serine protease [Candidatus Aenigmarchaeota archaeon]|nr:MAG: hypothetical protein DRP03_03030 [Candidatus Aenigmarchaeota archaeon]HDD46290.1 rhomboid family intramembrane serine protease [Candidatus Aenigmarchaeota archaeon]